MYRHLFLSLIFLCSLWPVHPVLAQEPVPDSVRTPLKLCRNWSGITVSPEEVPDGQMQYALRRDGPTWGFHGLVTANCTLPWMRSRFDLVEVTFWDLGRVVSLWVALGAVLWNQEYLPTGPGDYGPETVFRTYPPGTQVYVYLQGPHVFEDHIDWSCCQTVFCRIASQIDHQAWSGSNHLIEGSYPSQNHPLYGFLFWHVAVEPPRPRLPAGTPFTPSKGFPHEAY